MRKAQLWLLSTILSAGLLVGACGKKDSSSGDGDGDGDGDVMGDGDGDTGDGDTGDGDTGDGDTGDGDGDMGGGGGTGANGAPEADAGEDAETTGHSIQLDGSASSDPDGDTLSYSWTVVSGPSLPDGAGGAGGAAGTGESAALDDAETATPTLWVSAPGEYVLELEVSDGELTDTDQVSVIVCRMVNAFPVPVSSTTSIFGNVDDDFAEVDFAEGFEFDFYGTTYSSVFLNTNGGMTFGAGNEDYDLGSDEVSQPGIAVFWGDLDAGEDYPNRPRQMRYLTCPNRFEVLYESIADNDDDTWSNTGTVTLMSNGTIEVVYGDVLSEDILVGVFDGTHTDDTIIDPATATVANYTSSTGAILVDDHHDTEAFYQDVSGMTITYTP